MNKTIKQKNYFIQYLIAIRPHHWLKNMLVFLPALTGHLLTPQNLTVLAILFFSLCCVASGLYLLNDLLDLDKDKRHPTKKDRAIASGFLSIKAAKIYSLSLIVIGLVSSFSASFEMGMFISLYVSLVSFYSFYLKRVPFFEAFLLTLVYLLRIYMGAAVIDTGISEWMLIFPFFFFFFLILVKRYTELSIYLETNNENPTGRGYEIQDLNIIQSLGVSSALASLLVFCLYISSLKVQALYTNPVYLWAIALLGLLWVLNLIVVSNKGQLQDDPVIFAFTNKTSLSIFLISILVVFLSI